MEHLQFADTLLNHLAVAQRQSTTVPARLTGILYYNSFLIFLQGVDVSLHTLPDLEPSLGHLAALQAQFRN